MDRAANHLICMANLIAIATTLTACSDSFMKTSPRSKTSALAALSSTVDEAGNITATFDPSAGTTQVLKFNTGNLAGSAIAIPPGSLALPVSITVGEGETLTSTQFLQNLGITNNNVTAAGPSVSFVPSQNVEASNPFTLSLPLTITSLALNGSSDNIVVMYRWMKVVNGEPSYSMGIIPGDEVVISNNKVTFQTTKFGVFQLGKAETKITERVNVATIEPPALKKDAGNPLIGNWGTCQAANLGDSNYSEPTFLAPVWGSFSHSSNIYDVNSNRSHFNIRGKYGPLSVKKYAGPDCTSATPTSISTLGNAAFESISTSVQSFKILDSQSPTAGTSSCLNVHPKSSQLPYVRVNQVISQNQLGSMQISISWEGNRSGYRVSIFSDATCSTGVAGITNPIAQGNLTHAQVPVTNMTSTYFLKVEDESNSSISSLCIQAPAFPGSANIIDLTKIEENIFSTPMALNLNWTDSTQNGSTIYLVEYFKGMSCGISEKIATVESATNWISLTIPTDTRSIKISDKLVSTKWSQCAVIAPLLNKMYFEILNYRVGATWANLRWKMVSTSNPDLKLEQFSGLDCLANNRTSEIALSASNVFQNESEVFIDKLSANNTYSFLLSLRSNPNQKQCQNLMTTNADIQDWSANNTSPRTSSSDVIFSATSTVDIANKYKLKVSFNGDVPIDSYSTHLTSSNDAIELIKIPGADAVNKIITIWTPPGCFFKSFDTNSFSALQLPNDGTPSYINKVVCDGSSNGGGGSNSFGGSMKVSTLSKKMNLKITNGAFTMIEDLFQSDNCSINTRLSSRIELGSMVLPGADSVPDTYPVDVTTKDISGVIFTDEGVTSANTYPDRFGCGIKGWTRDKAQSLNSSSCADIGKTGYYRLKVVDGDKLYMCDSPDNKESGYGKSAATRIPTCDITSSSFYFKRE